MNATFTIEKEKVLTEIAKTTSYIGAKKEGDDGTSYDRIYTTDEDAEMLERFWDECASMVEGAVRRMIYSATRTTDSYTLVLDESASWDSALTAGMQDSLFSFFVMSIASKWQMLTDKADVNDYATLAAASLDDFRQKAFHRKKPTRPTYA